MKLTKTPRMFLGIGALLVGLLVSLFAIVSYFQTATAAKQAEKLREGGAIIENYYQLAESPSLWPVYVSLAVGLVGIGAGLWLLIRERHRANVSV